MKQLIELIWNIFLCCTFSIKAIYSFVNVCFFAKIVLKWKLVDIYYWRRLIFNSKKRIDEIT